jgi:hypothetical protein
MFKSVVLVHEIERSIVQGRGLSFKRSVHGLFASNAFQKLIGEANFAIDESRDSSAGIPGRLRLAGVCDPYPLSQGAFDSGAALTVDCSFAGRL